MARFRQETAGPDGWSEWIRPLEGYKLACCDCGLVHDVEFRLADDNTLNFRMKRNNRSTAAIRRADAKRSALSPAPSTSEAEDG